MLKKIYLSSLAFVMTACVSYHDPRSPAEQQAALSSARNKLSGDYEVIESRKDKYSGFAHASVRSQGDSFVVTLESPKRGPWKIQAMDCRGYDSVDHGYLSLMCSTSYDVNYVSIEQNRRGRTITDGAMLSSFEPMTISGDEYLLDIGMRGGRSYYYRLKRVDKSGEDKG